MKVLSALMVLLVVSSAHATSYCYDYGVMALGRLEEGLLSCEGKEGMNETIAVVEKMQRRLMAPSLPFLYKRRALKGLRALDAFMKELPETECNGKVRAEYEGRFRKKVEEAISWCQ